MIDQISGMDPPGRRVGITKCNDKPQFMYIKCKVPLIKLLLMVKLRDPVRR